MTGQLAELGFETRGAARVASVSGEVDMSNADLLLDRLMAELGQTPWLIVDLSECSYLDSAGLSVIARIGATARDLDVGLRLVVPEATSVDRVLAMTGMGNVVLLDRSLDEAIARASIGPADPADPTDPSAEA